MDVEAVVRARRMARSFSDRPVDPDDLRAVLDAARRAPSAGNAQGLDLLVLEGADQTGAYWDVTLPDERRAGFRWQGLLRAPVLVVGWVEPAAWVRRYAEDDKARTGLGTAADAWPVPYWWVDGGMAMAQLQLVAIGRGLGVCFFGLFDHEPAVRQRFGVPDDRRAIGTVAIGHPDGADGTGRSARRPRRDLDAVSHRGSW
ncbi:MAG: nitroreductase family protein [Actinomycetota bacterium]